MGSAWRSLAIALASLVAASSCAFVLGSDFDPKQLATTGGTGGAGGTGGVGGSGGVLLPNGNPCSEPESCQSGFCADEVCCESACDLGECQSCAEAGQTGSCVPFALGSPCPVTPGGTCDGAAFCSTGGELRWSAMFGATGVEQALSCGFNAAGELWVTGMYEGQLSFDGGTITHHVNSVAQRIFLARFGENGEYLWSAPFGDDDPDSDTFEVDDLAMGPTGGMALVGQLEGALNAGGAGLESEDTGDTAFLLVLDADGQHDWSLVYVGDNISGLGEDGYLRVAYGDDGRIAVAAAFAGSIELNDPNDPGLKVATGAAASFVIVYEPSGEVAWSRILDGPEGPSVLNRGVVLLPTGEVALTGAFNTADIEIGGVVVDWPGSQANQASSVYSVVFDGSGTLLDASSFGSALSVQVPTSLAGSPDGHVIMAGLFAGNDFSFGTLPLTNKNGGNLGLLQDSFVGKLTPANAAVWADAYGPTNMLGATYHNHVATDPAANVAVTGQVFDGMAVGGTTLNVTTDTFFTTKVNPDNASLWLHTMSVATPPPMPEPGLRINDVAGGPGGEVAICGFAHDVLSFDAGASHTSAGDRDIFVAVFGP